jgi:molecular chaperone GrpE (heat shock protein)
MNKHSWILWAVILMVPGAIGLGYYYVQKQALHQHIAAAGKAASQGSATEEYTSMYESWFRLSPEEKAENPWGQDPYGGPEIQKRLEEGQSDRLTADLPDLDRGIQHFPEELADTLYGSGWQRAVEEYRRQCSETDIVLIGAVFLLAGSGVLFVGGLGKMAFVYGLSRLKGGSDEPTGQDEDTDRLSGEQPFEEPAQAPSEEDSGFDSFAGRQPVSETEKVITSNRQTRQQEETDDDKEEQLGYFESRKKASQKTSSSSDGSKGVFSQLSKSLSAAISATEKPTPDSYFGWALPEGESEEMETLMTTEPLTRELTELTEEMSAIRQFAAQQQDQVRKLQDGYDWMIIRRFCMRIIRSIDNIEDRIGRLNEPDSELGMCLQDIRDELVFALESGGIEQFNPELEMPFKGLEKYAEAVRSRVPTENESLYGCIAEIVRPGYQYLISEDDVKIVRCAQVKLYDTQSK